MLLLYHIGEKMVIGMGKVSVEDVKPPAAVKGTKSALAKPAPNAAGAAKTRGGASTQATTTPHEQSRALCYNHELNHLAVGHNDGTISIRQVDGIDEACADTEPVELDNVIQVIKGGNTAPKEWIETMKYSPDMTRLAVGSHDNFIYLYNCDESQYQCFGKLRGHSSYITALDWDLDGGMIRSTCGAYELLFFNVNAPANKGFI
jgi:WD40 repeat protein